MNRRVSQIIDNLAPAKPELDDPNQLPLFPQLHRLHALVPPSAKTIALPRSILVIKADERLNHYLSRVAAAAMTAATKACGNPQRAAVRLGTAEELTNEHDRHDFKSPKPALRLATSKS